MAFLQEYTMLDEIGRGGFATVYKVRHNELGYIRAVRVLNDTIVDVNSVAYQKFLRECKVLLRLGNGNHPHIVHIYQPRLLDNKALVEMDFVDGQDLTHYLKQNQNFVPVEEVIQMAEQMSSALAYCHEDIYRFCMDRDADHLQDDPNDGSKILVDEATRKRLIDKYKVIHNDIHSGNIMRREDGSFVLLDFGLAINGNEVVRSSRHVNGAPEYKASEKWDDDSILTEQSDIYSFGIVLYHYLAGRVPFPYNTKISAHRAEFELGEAHQKAAPPVIEELRRAFYEAKANGQPYERDYPQWLEDIILKCLAKRPADRFANGRELHEAVMAGMEQGRGLKVEGLQATVSGLEKERDTLRRQLQQLESAQRGTNDGLQQREAALAEQQERLNVAQAGLQAQTAALEADRKRQDVARKELQARANAIELERETLKNETEKPIRRWKSVSIILLVLFLLGGAGAVYGWKIGDKGKVEAASLKTEQQRVDSLQHENKALKAKIVTLQTSNGNSAALLEQVNELKTEKNELTAENENLKSENEQLKKEKQNPSNNKLNGKTIEQWRSACIKAEQQRDNYKKLLEISL